MNHHGKDSNYKHPPQFQGDPQVVDKSLLICLDTCPLSNSKSYLDNSLQCHMGSSTDLLNIEDSSLVVHLFLQVVASDDHGHSNKALRAISGH